MSSSTPESAVRIIRRLLTQNPHLKSRQIFSLGTEGERPLLSPLVAFNDDGSLRMKRVANMREGKRPFVPQPVARFPEHPFNSVNYLKSHILASLESQNLIHKAILLRPAETDQEKAEAIRKAGLMTRRREIKALKAKEPVPPAVEPNMTIKEYAWKLGPAPKNRFKEDFAHLRSTSPAAAGSQPIASGSGRTNEKLDTAWEESAETEKAWEKASKLELATRRAELAEVEAILRRREDRAARYKVRREEEKRKQEELIQSGRIPEIKAEEKRLAALREVEKYAEQTGEDVSGWYEELGVELPPEYETLYDKEVDWHKQDPVENPQVEMGENGSPARRLFGRRGAGHVGRHVGGQEERSSFGIRTDREDGSMSKPDSTFSPRSFRYQKSDSASFDPFPRAESSRDHGGFQDKAPRSNFTVLTTNGGASRPKFDQGRPAFGSGRGRNRSAGSGREDTPHFGSSGFNTGRSRDNGYADRMPPSRSSTFGLRA